MKFFDAHTHAQFPAYDADRDLVMKRADDAGVGIVNVGTEMETSKEAVLSAEKYPNVWAVVGIHPTHAGGSGYHDPKELRGKKIGGMEFFDHDYYEKLSRHPKVVAIGECGLDYFRLEGDAEEAKKHQAETFLKQVELAHEVKKPLMIHCRSAFGDLIELLKRNSKILLDPPGIIHFFSGTVGEAEKLLELGFYFTFGGVITFVRDYDEVIRMIPAEKILSETDAPYVTPAPYRGKRNEPAHVIEVVKKLAELKDLSTDRMAGQILKNAQRIFRIDLTAV